MAFEIRPATREDIPDIAAVAVAAWEWAYTPFVPQEIMARFTDVPSRAERMADKWTDFTLRLAAVDEGQVIGFAFEGFPPGLEGWDAEIASLYVHPASAGCGVGGELVRAMAREFVVRGAGTMCIHTLVGNTIGRGFYEKMGGTKVADASWMALPSLWYGWRDIKPLV